MVPGDTEPDPEAICREAAATAAETEWLPDDSTSSEAIALISESLAQSTAADHLHAAAIMTSDDPARQIALVQRALSRSPNDAFLLYHAVQFCAESAGAVACPLEQWERRLVEAASENSEAWALVATSRYTTGRQSGALEALKHAAGAAESRAYWPDTVELLERSLAAAASLEFATRSGLAFGLAAQNFRSYGPLTEMCRARPADNIEWAYACLAYGRLAESRGSTVMTVSIGQGLQTIALESLDDTDEMVKLERRVQESRRRQKAVLGHEDQSLLVRWIMTPTGFARHIEYLKRHGELAANRIMLEEIDRYRGELSGIGCDQGR